MIRHPRWRSSLLVANSDQDMARRALRAYLFAVVSGRPAAFCALRACKMPLGICCAFLFRTYSRIISYGSLLLRYGREMIRRGWVSVLFDEKKPQFTRPDSWSSSRKAIHVLGAALVRPDVPCAAAITSAPFRTATDDASDGHGRKRGRERKGKCSVVQCSAVQCSALLWCRVERCSAAESYLACNRPALARDVSFGAGRPKTYPFRALSWLAGLEAADLVPSAQG